MSNIHGEIMPLPDATPLDIQQHMADTCAVKSQQIIMQSFGIDISEEQLTQEAFNKGIYMPGQGTYPEHVGILLNEHGIGTHMTENASVYDLVAELSQGHKVIVGVDSDELWKPSLFNDIYGENPNHALLVTGIDTTDPNNVKVIITDPGTGDVAREYPLDQFVDAWHDSNCFYVATDEAPSAEFDAGMTNFDFDAGHLPMIGEIPFDEYFPMLSEFSVFREDILENMEDCLNRLNGDCNHEIHAHDLQHNMYDHMHSVESIMQSEWAKVNHDMADHDFNSHDFDMHSHVHEMLYDNWDMNSFESGLMDSGIDFM